MKKFVKLNHDYEYEKDAQFIKLMHGKNALLNLMDNMEYDSNIRSLEKKHEQLKEQIEFYENKISVLEKQL